MSSARYPKRRRISERNKEATPPPEPELLPEPQAEPPYDNDSPDELAASSYHHIIRGTRRTSQPSRASSKLKRGRKPRQKTTVEEHAAPEQVPDELKFDATSPGARPDGLSPTPPVVSNAATEVDRDEIVLHVVVPRANPAELEADIVAEAAYRATPESPAISPLSHLNNAEDVSEADASPVGASPQKLLDDDNSFLHTFGDLPDAPATAASAQDLSEKLPTDQTMERTIPTLIRTTTNTITSFRGSFSRNVPRRSEDRQSYMSQSPPPYSRISTPIATPREVPTRPPQYVPYRQKMVLKGHKRGVADVRFSPDGHLIASCSADATIRIWDTATGKHLHTLEGHLAGISTIAWSPDSKTLASGSDDKSIRLWDVTTGKAYPHPLQAHSSYVYSLSFSPRGNILASGSYDEALFLWDVRTTRLMRSLPAHSDPIGGVDFIHDGTLIVSCSSDGLIRVWDTATGQCLRTLVHEDNASVTSVRFSPNGKFVLAWTLDSSVRLWNYVEGRCVKTYQGHKNEKYNISGAFGVYHNDEKTEEKAFVASGCEEGEIICWDVQSKEVLQKIGGHEGVVLGADTWNGGGLIVSWGLDKTVRIWAKEEGARDVRNGEGEQIEEDQKGMKEPVNIDIVNGEGHVNMVDGYAPNMDTDVVKQIEKHVVNGL